MRKWILLLLSAALVATVVIAQAQPGRGPGRGGPGGFQNMAFGTVANIDMNTGVMTVQAGFGGGGGAGRERTVQLTQETKLLEQQPAAAADLAVGKKLSVAGVPTQIAAGRLTVTDQPLEGAMLMGMGGFGMGRGGPGGGAQGFASAMGEIISTDPLKVQVSQDMVVEVTVRDDATFMQVVEAPEGALKQGVIVICEGQPDQNGVLTATTVMIVPQGMFGPRPGGPGGPPPAAAPAA